MVTIRIIKSYKGHKTGQIITVPNNDAHTLIDQGFAKLYQNKVMRT